MKAAALDYVARGFAVFPCYPRTKIPATEHGLRDAVSDRAGVNRLWKRRGYNIAIATGERSGVIVLDVDGPEGEASLAALQASHGALPVTLESSSGNGRHLYFRHPGRPVRNSTAKIGPKLDIRGDGGCVTVPPSIHPSGRRYAWVDEGTPIAEAPEWLVTLATKERERPEQTFERRHCHGERFPDAEVRRMLDILPADVSRDDWLRVGMALHAGGYPFEMWDDWSRTAPDRYVPGSTAASWRGFKDGGVTMGTLVHMARERGWEPERRDDHARALQRRSGTGRGR
ncbi:MAG: bifunctional DNA primase/polymerase [Acetobacteraceae bacterium]